MNVNEWPVVDATLQFFTNNGALLWQAFIETFQMTSVSLIISTAIGLPLGVLLVLTRPGQHWDHPIIYQVLNGCINILRSIPFIILLFFMLPFTKWLIGQSIGVPGAIVPLVAYMAPFIARLMESSLLEVDRGVIEAYKAMGIKMRDIVWRVMIREARPSIILGITIATIGLIGATAMAGLVGAGGLGDLAYRYGHLRYQADMMYAILIILIVIVQGIQMIGNRIANKLKKD